MKKILLLFSLFTLTYSAVLAQKPVKESDLKGVWKLVIDIDEEKVKDELDDEDNVLAQIFARSITNFVFDVIGEIDIRFEFLPDNRLRIETNVFGERDVEYSRWQINREGELIISDSEHFNVSSDDDDIWLKDGKYLMAYEKSSSGKRRNKEVYLKPVE